jgi:hypothetical protein
MRVRKSLFLVLAVSGLLGGSCLVGEGPRKAVGEGWLLADGGDPMPFPRPTQGIAERAEGAGILAADGGDPMPRPPHSLS